MLQLINIKKAYFTSNEVVPALRGISLAFRPNEFVSILGPSGCGKTTLLNIIGGLDKYSVGELRICGRNTSDFTDRDWDVYRNHRVGFIFQSYNLIPHQTILENVELALTIAGVSKEERVARAKRTLDRVGLSGMYKKRPNQLSGGQCQRVAIARALVNDPEILLADEPTGALDTKTSAQILDLIREIAGERLVIMVTHNPELAERYSTRIIRLLDGLVTEDSNPYSPEEENKEYAGLSPASADTPQGRAENDRTGKKAKKTPKEKAKMSFFTAFRLSARNLISKRRRTFLVGFAGSIGIIGIAMVLSISAGIKGYVASMQDDMLSGNPIRISESAYDTEALTELMKSNESKVKNDRTLPRVFINSLVEYMAKTSETTNRLLIRNDITAEYVNFVRAMPAENYAAVLYGYGIDFSNNIYADFRETAANTPRRMSVSALTSVYTSILKETRFREYAYLASSFGNVFSELPDNSDYVLSQYEVVSGKMATGANEAVLVLDSDSCLTDILLAKLGYYTQEEFLNIVYRATEDEAYNAALFRDYFRYEDILGRSFFFYPNDSLYRKNTVPEGLPPALAAEAEKQVKAAPFSYRADMTDATEQGTELRVVGILRPKESTSFGCLKTGFYYTSGLVSLAREQNRHSEIARYLSEHNMKAFEMTGNAETSSCIPYTYTYHFKDEEKNGNGVVGSVSLTEMTGMGGSGTLKLTLAALGAADLPSSITIYPRSFDSKDAVTRWLDRWNEEGKALTYDDVTIPADARSNVRYTDTLAIIIAVINSMINVVSTALIAFTSVSLVVSTVMIGILTYVSVVERIKEIGVIRSLGGRKKDVRHLFNAETFIIGFLAGLIGVLITSLLSLLLNLVIHVLTGLTVTAALPWYDAILMLALSTVLTLISGLIPAAAAARKDPVVALRTE